MQCPFGLLIVHPSITSPDFGLSSPTNTSDGGTVDVVVEGGCDVVVEATVLVVVGAVVEVVDGGGRVVVVEEGVVGVCHGVPFTSKIAVSRAWSTSFCVALPDQ